ncbi:MAG TPA: hypothetical protein VMZ27_04075 [Candidatus Saccharimonadales bacterium]|nr:hypothetical protein [Candidatus Saccharimonadales bacterium]
MNSSLEKIEELLHKAPKVSVPKGLLDDLTADIYLPRKQTMQAQPPQRQSPLRRWFPVLALSCWLITCLVLLAVERGVVSRLRQETAALRASSAEKSSSIPSSPTTQEEAELESLRKNSAEAKRLRVEVAELRQQLSALEALRAQNHKLAAELQAKGAAAGPNQDFFAAASEKATRLKCVNNLKQVGLAARIYANDHQQVFPSDYASMKDEISNEAIIHCPGSPSTNYEMLSPGIEEGDPNIVLFKCPVHNNVGMSDGSVQQLGERFQVVRRADGKLVVGKVN